MAMRLSQAPPNDFRSDVRCGGLGYRARLLREVYPVWTRCDVLPFIIYWMWCMSMYVLDDSASGVASSHHIPFLRYEAAEYGAYSVDSGGRPVCAIRCVGAAEGGPDEVCQSLPFILLSSEERKWLESDTAYQGSPILSALVSSAWLLRFFLGILLFAIIYLVQTWSIRLYCWFRFKRCDSIGAASHVLVLPSGVGSPTLCKIHSSQSHTWILLNHKKMIYDRSVNDFVPVKFPIDLKLEHYMNSEGLVDKPVPSVNLKATCDTISDVYVSRALDKYGRNVCDLPIPTFRELLFEQLTSPFFCFQVFCMLLWLMDEYWVFPLVMLFMIVGIEAQTAAQRRMELNRIRSMCMTPSLVLVYRRVGTSPPCKARYRTSDEEGQGWSFQTSDSLLPGDVFMMPRMKPGDTAQCPVDCVLLQGTAVADESILTGESVPQAKVSLGIYNENRELGDETAPTLDFLDTHKQCILFAGTRVLASENQVPSFCGSKLPQKQPVAYVLRTGFYTMQGKLMRTIMQSNERVTASNGEAWCFLGILLIVAIIPCIYIFYAAPISPFSYHYRSIPMRAQWVVSALQQFVPLPVSVSGVGLKAGAITLSDDSIAAAFQPSVYRLFLSLSQILTSVIPAEFPLMLSLTISMGLLQLVKVRIFCTEGYRLAHAGKVRMCAFDKTGTLTENRYSLVGIHGCQLPGEYISPTCNKSVAAVSAYSAESLERQQFPIISALVVGCAHSLTVNEGCVIGDPLERTCFETLGWSFQKSDCAVLQSASTPSPTSKICGSSPCVSSEVHGADVVHGRTRTDARVTFLKRYPFSSVLQRSTSIARCDIFSDSWRGSQVAHRPQSVQMCERHHSRYLIAVKGAPERLRRFFKICPSFYEEMARDLTIRGYRVLALGGRFMDNDPSLMPRDELERELDFCGFLTLTSRLKPRTAAELQFLRESGLDLLLLTGDHPLTACKVAAEVGIFHSTKGRSPGGNPPNCTFNPTADRTFQAVLLKSASSVRDATDRIFSTRRQNTELCVTNRNYEEKFVWVSPNESLILPFSLDSIPRYQARFHLCITGPEFEELCSSSGATSLRDKVALLRYFLPYVQVYSRMSPAQKQLIIEAVKSKNITVMMCGDGTNDVGALKAADVGVSLLASLEPDAERQKSIVPECRNDYRQTSLTNQMSGIKWLSRGDMPSDKRDQLRNLLEELDSRRHVVKLGEASIASSFTSRGDSIECVSSILRTGRTTLVLVLMMYKMMALGSITSAFGLSVMIMDGVKMGDLQASIMSILGSLLTVCISYTKPRGGMGKTIPVSSIFNPFILLSLIGQAAIHLYIFLAGWHLARDARNAGYVPDLDAPFAPNLVNTVVYLLMGAMHVSTVFANYEGKPFMPPILQNKAVLLLLSLNSGLVLLLASGWICPLNRLLDIAPFPNEAFRFQVLALMGCDFALPWAVSVICKRLELLTR